MSDNSNITWCNATWNVLVGCKKVCRACDNCYAIRDSHVHAGHPNAKMKNKFAGTTTPDGKDWTGIVTFTESVLTQPLIWTRPRFIFPNSASDMWYSKVLPEWRDRIFAVMVMARWHTFQCLTKRPKAALRYLEEIAADSGRVFYRAENTWKTNNWTMQKKSSMDDWAIPSKHIHIGTSIGDQVDADRCLEVMSDISKLGWPTWVSYEPALGPVDWTDWEFLNTLVVGGESGPGARPSHPDWFRTARDWAIEHSIPFHFKQWGEWGRVLDETGTERSEGTGPLGAAFEDDKPIIFKRGERHGELFRIGKKNAGRLLDGRTWDELMPLGVPQCAKGKQS